MNKATTEEAVPLSSVYGRGVENKIVNHALVAESRYRNNCCNDNNDQRKSKLFHFLKIKANSQSEVLIYDGIFHFSK